MKVARGQEALGTGMSKWQMSKKMSMSAAPGEETEIATAD
jgi:hypothetical protein